MLLVLLAPAAPNPGGAECTPAAAKAGGWAGMGAQLPKPGGGATCCAVLAAAPGAAAPASAAARISASNSSCSRLASSSSDCSCCSRCGRPGGSGTRGGMLRTAAAPGAGPSGTSGGTRIAPAVTGGSGAAGGTAPRPGGGGGAIVGASAGPLLPRPPLLPRKALPPRSVRPPRPHPPWRARSTARRCWSSLRLFQRCSVMAASPSRVPGVDGWRRVGAGCGQLQQHGCARLQLERRLRWLTRTETPAS